MAKSCFLVVFLLLGIIFSIGTNSVVQGQLSTNFYQFTCPAAEQIVRSIMVAHFQQDPKIAAHLLRMQFHDCAATGCDASVLLTGPNSEQEAPPNLTLLGFDVINDIKAALEQNCTGIVSCADIITMTARDAVALTGGPNFSVPLGRFDSTFSGGSNVNLPSADDSVTTIVAYFQTMGLSALDVTVLLGAHTIGSAHCSSFSDRLYNFHDTGAPDPSMDPAFLATMQQSCPQANANASSAVALDQQSEYTFDNHFYNESTQRHGVLGVDQEISMDSQTNVTVSQLAANQTIFFQGFVTSLIKLGTFGVKDSTTGNIRTNCSVVGTSSATAPAPEPEEVAPAPTAGG